MGPILVLNAGSSSLKFSLFTLAQTGPEFSSEPQEIMRGLAERLGENEAQIQLKLPDTRQITLPTQANHQQALKALGALVHEVFPEIQPTAVGHRVVHGGETFQATTPIDDAMINTLSQLIPLAPLHNPANLQGIQAALEHWPEAAQYAVFDTAFHQTMPPKAFLYALPYELYQAHSLRRFGFHGTSHAYLGRRLPDLVGHADCQRVVTAHLGNGCSLAALKAGQSVDTTMGFTPLEGLVMGTRSGDVDPGVLFFLMEQAGYTANQLEKLLNKSSGLLGLSGRSNDYRALNEARLKGDERAKLALDIFAYRCAKHIAALTVPLGGIDILAFTGGIGEYGSWVRGEIVTQLQHLGLSLDPQLNQNIQGEEGCISRQTHPSVWVIPTREEWMIAREVQQALLKEKDT